jgi:hypothetical protein
MPRGRIGSMLIATGVIVGVVASLGVIVDFEPAQLPPALLNIAAYKLTFLAAGGLIAAGAIALRRARRHAEREDLELRGTTPQRELEGPAELSPGDRRSVAPERVESSKRRP